MITSPIINFQTGKFESPSPAGEGNTNLLSQINFTGEVISEMPMLEIKLFIYLKF